MFGRSEMRIETETTGAELYVSKCCLFEKIITKNQIITRCLMNVNVSGQKLTTFRRILQRLFGLRSACRCECHHHVMQMSRHRPMDGPIQKGL
jgi:hypothetical protein